MMYINKCKSQMKLNKSLFVLYLSLGAEKMRT
jgi:hypothetical protein